MFGLTTQAFAQVETEKLSEIEITGLNDSYLEAVNKNEPSIHIREYHKRVADFKFFKKNPYDNYTNYEYTLNYQFTFYLPNGRIYAIYDNEGVLVETFEQFNTISLPIDVREAIRLKYPDWTQEETYCYINYDSEKGAKKKYKLLLSKNGKKTRVRLNPDGDIL